MNNIFYLMVIIIGFVIPIISCIIFNKYLKIITFEKLLYSYIFSMIFFIIFAKIFYIILDVNVEGLKVFITDSNIVNKLGFLLSGYSFMGGYIGSIISLIIFSKVINVKEKDIFVIYLPALILMYSILKIGCFIKGCCISKYEIPVQLIESGINLISYFWIIINLKKYNKNKIIGISLICFGLFRFLISIIRVYANIYSFIFIQLICISLIIIGLKTLSQTNK